MTDAFAAEWGSFIEQVKSDFEARITNVLSLSDMELYEAEMGGR